MLFAVLVVENSPAESKVDADGGCSFWWCWFHVDSVNHGVLCPFFHGQESACWQWDVVLWDLKDFLWKLVISVVAGLHLECAFCAERE